MFIHDAMNIFAATTINSVFSFFTYLQYLFLYLQGSQIILPQFRYYETHATVGMAKNMYNVLYQCLKTALCIDS